MSPEFSINSDNMNNLYVRLWVLLGFQENAYCHNHWNLKNEFLQQVKDKNKQISKNVDKNTFFKFQFGKK